MSRRVLALVVALAVVLTLAPAHAVPLSTARPTQRHEGSILVRLAAGADAGVVHRLAGVGQVASRIPELSLEVVTVPEGSVDVALAAYRSLPGVVYAEPNIAVRLSATPNDPLLRDQYALKRMGMGAAWDRYGRHWRRTGGARVAIVDTGIDRLQSEFASKVRHCRNWVTALGVGAPGCHDSGVHGTHVAGIAAAAANNRRSIAGVAFDAELMVLQAFNSTGVAFTADLAAAISYAATHRAHVANYSFGSPTHTRALRDAVAYAARRGVLQVAAAGNDGRPNAVNYPAKYPEVMAVSATDERDRLAPFSSTGSQVDVAAPGAAILSTLPGGVYGRLSGTSMAAPHVTGVAALLRARGLSADQARERIVRGADDLGPRGWDPNYGHGRVNAARSLR